VKSKAKNIDIDWDELASLYEEAQGLSHLERNRFLDTYEKSKPEIVAELRALFSEGKQVSAFMAKPISLGFPIPLLRPGEVVLDFEIHSLLGKGAAGMVYLAKQRSLDRYVALKVTPNVGSEAKTMAQLVHPNIVPIFSESIHNNPSMRLICMSYIPGSSLDHFIADIAAHKVRAPISGKKLLDWLSDQVENPSNLNLSGMKTRDKVSPMGPDELFLWIGTQLCDALIYAHQQGILHLDLKPGNVVIDVYGGVYLADFSISWSKKLHEELSATSFGGTPGYMSPEQQNIFTTKNISEVIKKLDDRSDIYSLGMLLTKLGKHLGVSRYIMAVLKKACSPSPESRYQSMKELQRALNIQRELAAIYSNLPRKSSVIENLMKKPLFTLTVFGTVPQIISAVLGMQYNALQVFSQLTFEQMRVVEQLNRYYTPVVYLILGTFWCWKLVQLYNQFELKTDASSINSFRRYILELPFWGMLMSCLGWLPSALVYPLAITFHGGIIERSVLLHLLTSFTLSWLIALSYSFLLQQFLVLRFVFPYQWSTDELPSSQAEKELKAGLKWTHRCAAISGLIPLLSAVLLLSLEPGKLDAASFYRFKNLIMALLSCSLMGLVFTQSIVSRCEEIARAFRKKTE